MLSFPPPVPPQELPTLQTRFRPRPDSPPPTIASTQLASHHRQQQHRRDEERRLHNTRSPLALLMAEEAAIAQRKQAIREYGSYWIRPAGISKTLQAMRDEEQERIEQEEFARQEMGWRDMQAVQEQAEAQQRAAGEIGVAEAEPETGFERDLDAEIPDADDSHDQEPSFNEDSMLGGSRFVPEDEIPAEADSDDAYTQDERFFEADMEEAELVGIARDEADLGMQEDRNLDDSIPEADTFQHSDSDKQETTSDASDSETQEPFAMRFVQQDASRDLTEPASRNVQRVVTRMQLAASDQQGSIDAASAGEARTRRRVQDPVTNFVAQSPDNLRLSSSLVGSSFMESSPIVQRTGQSRRGTRRFHLSRQPEPN